MVYRSRPLSIFNQALTIRRAHAEVSDPVLEGCRIRIDKVLHFVLRHLCRHKRLVPHKLCSVFLSLLQDVETEDLEVVAAEPSAFHHSMKRGVQVHAAYIEVDLHVVRQGLGVLHFLILGFLRKRERIAYFIGSATRFFAGFFAHLRGVCFLG